MPAISQPRASPASDLDKNAVKWIARVHPQTTWIVPLGLGAYIRGWGAREIVELDWWQEVAALPSRWLAAAHCSPVIRRIIPGSARLARIAARGA